MAVDALARLHEGHRVAHDGARDAGERCKVRELEMRCQRGGLVAHVQQHVLGLHAHVAKARGARCAQPLAEAAPVVHALHALRLGGHERDHAVAAAVVVQALGRDRDPVGIQRACAVELVAVEPPGVAVALQGGLQRLERAVAEFGGGVAEDHALGRKAHPRAVQGGVDFRQQPLDEAEVRAQDLRQVGVGLAQFDEQVVELLHRAAQAAVLERHAQRAEALGVEPGHGFVGEFAVGLALGGALGDALEDGAEAGSELLERRRLCERRLRRGARLGLDGFHGGGAA